MKCMPSIAFIIITLITKNPHTANIDEMRNQSNVHNTIFDAKIHSFLDKVSYRFLAVKTLAMFSISNEPTNERTNEQNEIVLKSEDTQNIIINNFLY